MIDGKTEKTDKIFCKTCENGNKLGEIDVLKTTKEESLYDEKICLVCNTKYLIQKKINIKLTDESCMGCEY